MGSERRSVGSGPITASRARTTSGILRAIGPRVLRWCQPGACGPPEGMRPREGLNPESPHSDDGMRMEPPPSEPVASGTMPAAMAAALPPDEPPGLQARSHGFLVAPNRGLTVSA